MCYIFATKSVTLPRSLEKRGRDKNKNVQTPERILRARSSGTLRPWYPVNAMFRQMLSNTPQVHTQLSAKSMNSSLENLMNYVETGWDCGGRD